MTVDKLAKFKKFAHKDLLENLKDICIDTAF